MARNTVGGIMPTGQRGQYTVRGTPTGSALRSGWARGRNVLGGQIFTGQGGVQWVFRPQGPRGAGWYKRGGGPGSAPGAPSPTQAGVTTRPPASVAATTTIPPVAPTGAPPPPPPAPTPWAPDPNWWLQQFQGTSEFQQEAPQIAARENAIASQFGFVIRRDTTQGSPTYGQALYRPRGGQAGSGTVRATLENVPGSVPPQAKYVYRDASGREYSPADLEMDVVSIRQGDPAYREGALGRTQMQSRARQADIGSEMAQRGLRRSGIRAAESIGEGRSLQDALRSLVGEAGTEFAGTTSRWMDLFNRLYPGLAGSAQGLYDASVAPPAAPEGGAPEGGAPEGGEGGGEAGGGATTPTGPQFSFGGTTYSQGDPIPPGPNGIGKFSRKLNFDPRYQRLENGKVFSFKKKLSKPKPRELFRGPNGIWYAYRPSGPNGAGWYRQP